MTRNQISGILLTILLIIIIFISGCSSFSRQQSSPTVQPRIEYTLSEPLYANKWYVVVNLTNVGDIQPEIVCIKINLLNNQTGAIEEHKYYHIMPGPKPGITQTLIAEFSSNWKANGYYRASGESCSEYPPVYTAS